MSFFSMPKPIKRKKTSRPKLEWEADPAIQKQMEEIVETLDLTHVKSDRVFCYRTTGSKARAYARIWSFPKIFQQVLSIEPAYVLEIISEKFDGLNDDNRKKVIIHELLHIPKNFSGSLLPHSNGHTSIEKEVGILFDRYRNSK